MSATVEKSNQEKSRSFESPAAKPIITAPGVERTGLSAPDRVTAKRLNSAPLLLLEPVNQSSSALGSQARPCRRVHPLDKTCFLPEKSSTETVPLVSPNIGWSRKAIRS